MKPVPISTSCEINAAWKLLEKSLIMNFSSFLSILHPYFSILAWTVQSAFISITQKLACHNLSL